MQNNIKPMQLPSVPTSLRQAQEMGAGPKSPRSTMEIRIIKNLISSYFNIVRKSLNDIVPKTIIAFLINKSKNLAQRDLVQNIITEDCDIKALLVEDGEVVEKRRRCEEMIKTLRKCLEYLSEVRDFSIKDDEMQL
jgi:replication fork clamp-binding protein CrfC